MGSSNYYWRDSEGRWLMLAVIASMIVGSLVIYWLQITHVSKTADDFASRQAARPKTVDNMISVQPTVLKVQVTGFRNPSGICQIAVFRSKEGFPDPKNSVLWKVIKYYNGQATWNIEGITPGQVAIMAFEDEDQDGELSKSPEGILEEYLGFSQDARSTQGTPSFDDAKITIELNRTLNARILLHPNFTAPKTP